MLATGSLPLREHSHLDFHTNSGPPHSDQLALEDRLCPGCKKSVVNEQGGLVVAFGSVASSSYLVCPRLDPSLPFPGNPSSMSTALNVPNVETSCNICQLPILDEAIMTGDDSYHAHCFKCKVCSNRIDELVFAKTSQGIYCMNCHNERMIKIRKHAQKKAERERANGGSGSSRSRENDARNFHRDTDARSGASKPPPIQQPSRSEGPRVAEPSNNAAKPAQAPYMNDAFDPTPPYSHPSHLDSPSFTLAPPGEPERNDLHALNSPRQSFDSSRQNKGPSRTNTLPVPPLSTAPESKRRSSYDDGVRPLNNLLKQDTQADKNTLHPNALLNSSASTEGLSVTSRRDKRRSINPGATLPSFKDVPSNQASDAVSRSASFSTHEQSISSSAPPYMTSSGQSQAFTKPTPSSSRPPSSSSSTSSTSHFNGADQIRSRSPSVQQSNQDDTITMASPPSRIAELENGEPITTNANFNDDRTSSNTVTSQAQRSSATLSPIEQRFRRERRLSSNSTHSKSPSRAASPAYRADVPRGIESGTDTETDDTDASPYPPNTSLPPAPPPKDVKDLNHNQSAPPNISIADTSVDPDSSEMFPHDMSDDMNESLAVERTSRATFIAPALPPIRISLSPSDFSELLSSMGGFPPLKSLDNLANLTKQSQLQQQQQQDTIPSTPPPTASLTPTVKVAGNTPTLGISESDDGQEPIYSDYFPDVGNLNKSSASHSRTPGSSDSSAASSPSTIQPSPRRNPSESDLVILRLREILNGAKEKGAQHLKVDIGFVEAIVELLESKNNEYYRMKNKVDGMNRESKMYMDGLTVAQAEYDRELKARRDAEAEVTKLRVLLSGQAVRLSTLSGDRQRQELRQQLSQQLNENLSGLEHDLSRLKVERDVTLAEVEELSTKKSSGSAADVGPTNLGRSLTKKLEGIRNQYQRELVPLTEQKEVLTREIAELKAVRDVFLEETAALNARNEELAQLSAVYSRRLDNATPEAVPEAPSKPEASQSPNDNTRSQAPTYLVPPSLSTSTSGSTTVYDDSAEPRIIKAQKSENELHTPAKPKFKWPGTKAKDFSSPSSSETTKGKAHIEHNFQQLSILRFTRCDHCGDKMWGSQLRCTVCSTSIHVRCIANVHIPCSQQQQQHNVVEERIPLPPSMFGRDLTEQVHADARGDDRQVPVIVEKCIQAVEARALDYEGIYRKSGGSGQTKAITQLFERGDYASFDLCDMDKFNDICSITSVLKTYFRLLPIPLLTFDLHDQFTAAIDIKDSSKHETLVDLVHRLPDEHFFTLRMLMLHLHRVYERSERNLMSARNLGVVFGPTLMRSRDPAAEFSDMAGKALFIEWLVENAMEVFDTTE
ncbi:N-chimaerin [Psilocybe cubensis]|uniref:N-chimaerin n=1 Tax=Psilocybe cubensis TaxID=181762 RepID=A0ACB8HBP4_PSICU|nr:N-chimaerin [Psilocybe cubensis]KAH9485348.1 N-chimaerin [Psilocybe cubensis]